MSRKETSSIITRRTMLKGATALAVTAAVGLRPWSAEAALDAAQTWVDNEFQPSTLTKDQQMEEMKFFVDAAKPYAGMDINVVSETIDTHVYETKTLAKAFREITGINLKHDIIQEGDVIEKLQTQMQSGKNVFDMYINDSDLIGTHFRYGEAIPLSDFMAGEGKDVTLPTLDVDDFIGKSFTTAPDGKLYQLPDQQFANLYWFRADWFDRADLKEKFKAKYGYDLGVPVNWSAYEDIANFFSNDVKEIDGVRVYGHMDYGKKDPSLGWRFTDAWLSMAGEADKGIPNGLPVDEWGIRVEDCHPGRRLGQPGRRGEQPGGRLCADEIHRLDEEICPAGGAGHDLLRGRSRSRTGQYRPADLLVHRLHGRAHQAGPSRWSMPTARRSGAWPRRPMDRTGRKACRTATRIAAPGPC